MVNIVEKLGSLLRRHAKYNPDPLYEAIVAQARHKKLYQAPFLIPNTLDGRFDSLCLHLHLVLRQLNKQQIYKAETKILMERFIQDMDQSMREVGVGDMSVGKHVTNMAKAYFGRSLSYEESLHNLTNLEEVITRNLLGLPLEDEINASAQQLAIYVQAQDETLSTQDGDQILKGDITFHTPTPFANVPSSLV